MSVNWIKWLYQIKPYQTPLALTSHLAEARFMQAVRDGFLWLVPCLLLSAMLLILATVLELMGVDEQYVGWIRALYLSLSALTPVLVVGAIGYMRAVQYRISRPPVVFLSIVYLLIAEQWLGKQAYASKVLVLFLAIVLPLLTVPVLARLLKIHAFQLTDSDLAGGSVKDSLNMIVPGMLTAVVVWLGVVVIQGVMPTPAQLDDWFFLDYANEPYQSGLLFAGLNSSFWFFGVHGYQALLPWVDTLEQALYLNNATVLAGGDSTYPMNSAFLGAFVFIGGCGATLSLIIAILLVSQERHVRLIALASIPIALLNVNEILLFGLPIILNPRLLLPFLLVPMLNVIVGLSLTQSGWVGSAVAAVPFNTPVILNALLATKGDVGAVAMQIFNCALGVLLYLPFIKGVDRQARRRVLAMKSLETLYDRRLEEAAYSYDPVQQATQARMSNRLLREKLALLDEQEFVLHFQPQVWADHGRIKGCEALIRAKDACGHIIPPSEFLPWMEQAELMSELDRWVVKACCRQMQNWQQQGIDVAISFNLTAQSLESEEVIESILYEVSHAPGQYVAEITEQSLAGNFTEIRAHIEKLRAIGIKIAIDDFGTGYSSLSYLHRYPVDIVKIDRSFVVALAGARGQQVFAGLLALAENLALDIVVEGVETRWQHDWIAAHAAQLSIQGWYYSKPLPVEQFKSYYEAAIEPRAGANGGAGKRR